MKRRSYALPLFGALVVAVMLVGIIGAGKRHADTPQDTGFYVFPGVVGPPGQDKIAPPAPARIDAYDHGSVHRLAVLVTDPDSDWLGLVRAFKAAGLPFTITRDPQRAYTHKVVLIYPIISGRVMSSDALRGLGEHVRAGGAVLAFNLAGGGLEPVFGVKGETTSRAHETLHWLDGAPGAPEEDTTGFSKAGTEDDLGSYAFEPVSARVVARYEDGAAGVTCREQVGRACLMGVDLGAFAQRAIDGRDEGVARTYVNHYEPSLDVMVRWVKTFYVENEPMPWLIDTAPPGKDVSIVLSHDIDYTRSVVNAAAYAKLELSAGIKATYFMQTKYIRDYNDDVFLTRETVPLLQALKNEGMEIGSHTVAHSKIYNKMPIGDGREQYPSYRPFVETFTATRGGTVFGEARVSKYLLERLVGAHIQSFRPGHLSYPFKLPEVLEASGYSFSSSVTANSCLTHLPHQMTFGRAGENLVPVYEFPLTIEDEATPRLGDRFEMESNVISKIAAHHGLVVILIHPNILDHKLAFETKLIERWKDRAWMPDLAEFGSWWRARDRAEFDIDDEGKGYTLKIHAPEEVNNVSIVLPKANIAPQQGPGVRVAGDKITVDNARGDLTLQLTRAAS